MKGMWTRKWFRAAWNVLKNTVRLSDYGWDFAYTFNLRRGMSAQR